MCKDDDRGQIIMDRDPDDEETVWIPIKLLQSREIGPPAKVVYMALESYRQQGQMATRDEIAAAIGEDHDTVDWALKQLQYTGWIDELPPEGAEANG